MTNIKRFLRRLFGMETEADMARLLKNEPRIYTTGGGLGNAITFTGSRRVVGWKFRIPEVGDLLVSKMESGKWGRFVFANVERARDPEDMFFADMALIGYTDGFPLPPSTRATS